MLAFHPYRAFGRMSGIDHRGRLCGDPLQRGMGSPANFHATSGKARYLAVLERYRVRELGPQMACEHLAELLTENAAFSQQQRDRILAAHGLVHDLSDGMAIGTDEFEAILPARKCPLPTQCEPFGGL